MEAEKNYYSDEAYEIIKGIPPSVLHWSIILSLLIVMSLIGVSYKITYPLKYSVEIMLFFKEDGTTGNTICGLITIDNKELFKKGDMVKVDLEKYPASEFGYLYGTVESTQSRDSTFCSVFISFNEPLCTSMNYQIVDLAETIKGKIEIEIHNERLINRLVEL